MPPRSHPLLWLILSAALGMAPVRAADPPAPAEFHRAINLNGPALRIDGHDWEAGDTTNLVVEAKGFENQAVVLKPATDRHRARMIRSSRWGNRVDVRLTGLPAGPCQVFLYVWEDNHSEQFDLLVNDRVVEEKFHSGDAGSWRRLGPWPAEPVDGALKVSARGPGHGAANLPGIEIWTGAGPVPPPPGPAFADAPTPAQRDFFEARIRPVLAENCYSCHSARAEKLKGGLLLDSRAGIRRGGDNGPVITPGDPEASLLVAAVRHDDPNLAMPPREKLPAHAIEDLVTWIRDGAPDPRDEDTVAAVRTRDAIDWDAARQWWAFRPLADPAPPAVADTDWPAGAIDRFILSRQEAAGLRPAADADRRTLIRRVTFDLTGLPPTPAEIDAFLADPESDPAALRRVVDRLLDSPRYGERWGRHWLDVVRYADTAGDNSDFPIPQMRRYQDWVIEAFNRDLPYDRFVTEQLAGDLLPAATPEERRRQVVATGYIANARRFGSRVDDYPQHLTIEDTLDNLWRAFLGLSLSCARCHDHKFDPIPAADYYALYGIFHSTRYPWPGIELDQRQRDLVPLVPADEADAAVALMRERESEKGRLEKEVRRLRDALKEAPEAGRDDARMAVADAEMALAEHVARPLPFDLAYAVAESPRPADTPIQVKGDPARPGPVVRRRFLTVLGGRELPADVPGSGRRELAAWLTDPANPLPDLVLVNRVWQHHFGRGLVPTPNDFGRQGQPPTHPELLDWLAGRFRESGRSIKELHRLLLASRTWRQASVRPAGADLADPSNQLLAGFPRRRMDAESLRDTLLALGGTLREGPAGGHPFPPASEWKFTQHNPFKAVYPSDHRSIYLMTQRLQRHPFLAIFDGADPSASTAARLTTTTPVQALHLLNDPMIHAQSEGFARRLREGEPDPDRRLALAYRTALGREPDPVEAAGAREFLAAAAERLRGGDTPPDRAEAGAWAALARVLFSLNEFVHID